MMKRYIYLKSANQISDYNQRNSLKKQASALEGKIKQYQDESKIMILSKLRKDRNFKNIDLHGFFLDEALDLLFDQMDYIQKQCNKKNYNDANVIQKEG